MYDATFKICVFGDGGSGKSTLAHRYMTNAFITDLKMTIGVDFQVKTIIVDGKTVKLQIWDFGGEERFRFLLPAYIRGAMGAIFMYDITNYASLAHIDDWLLPIKQGNKNELPFPIFAVGGKLDLEDGREVTKEEGKEIIITRGLSGFYECSSKTGICSDSTPEMHDISKIFEDLTRLMLQNL